MATPSLDAYDLLFHAEALELRLVRTGTELSKRGLVDEAQWLDTAHRRIARARDGSGELSMRALRLPELETVKAERGRALQGAAVDAVEALAAAIVRAGGDRSPLLEALVFNLKIALMRRAGQDEFDKFGAEIEKRLGSGYVTRMLADAAYRSVDPVVEGVRRAFDDWRSVVSAPPLSEAEAQALRSELEAIARRVELPCRQARLLADAALLSAEDLRESSGIFDKPKRRAARPVRLDAGAENAPEAQAATPPAPDVAATHDSAET
ncbi:MAG TPA: hypothetical protein VM580_34510 [Labilithrix sp.]|jgi:hypothetical protein|nr:hypothetical protein [Labilithrix sp.]